MFERRSAISASDPPTASPIVRTNCDLFGIDEPAMPTKTGTFDVRRPQRRSYGRVRRSCRTPDRECELVVDTGLGRGLGERTCGPQSAKGGKLKSPPCHALARSGSDV
jgi:hypothetical protein